MTSGINYSSGEFKQVSSSYDRSPTYSASSTDAHEYTRSTLSQASSDSASFYDPHMHHSSHRDRQYVDTKGNPIPSPNPKLVGRIHSTPKVQEVSYGNANITVYVHEYMGGGSCMEVVKGQFDFLNGWDSGSMKSVADCEKALKIAIRQKLDGVLPPGIIRTDVPSEYASLIKVDGFYASPTATPSPTTQANTIPIPEISTSSNLLDGNSLELKATSTSFDPLDGKKLEFKTSSDFDDIKVSEKVMKILREKSFTLDNHFKRMDEINQKFETACDKVIVPALKDRVGSDTEYFVNKLNTQGDQLIQDAAVHIKTADDLTLMAEIKIIEKDEVAQRLADSIEQEKKGIEKARKTADIAAKKGRSSKEKRYQKEANGREKALENGSANVINKGTEHPTTKNQAEQQINDLNKQSKELRNQAVEKEAAGQSKKKEGQAVKKEAETVSTRLKESVKTAAVAVGVEAANGVGRVAGRTVVDLATGKLQKEKLPEKVLSEVITEVQNCVPAAAVNKVANVALQKAAEKTAEKVVSKAASKVLGGVPFFSIGKGLYDIYQVSQLPPGEEKDKAVGGTAIDLVVGVGIQTLIPIPGVGSFIGTAASEGLKYLIWG
jgi:hypothetical protein